MNINVVLKTTTWRLTRERKAFENLNLTGKIVNQGCIWIGVKI